MNDIVKTTLFVAVAAVLAGAAGLNQFFNQPSNSADFDQVGKPFFEEFESTANIASLEVSAIDPETGELKQFIVQKQNGLWTIPTHFDYPAEAAARLAETGSSVMGIEREAFVGRLASEHARLGVVDPLSSDLEDPAEAGQRITMKDVNDEVVVDLIIGKQSESEASRPEDMDIEAVRSEPRQTFYVRRPDEQQTYQVQLDIDLSTQFSDWIDPDLLRIEPSDLKQIRVNNYTLEASEQSGVNALVRSQGDQLMLTRESDVDPWVLDEMDADTEELDSTRVDEIVRVLDELKIAGVRPKFKFKNKLLLTPDLKLNQQPEFKEDIDEFRLAINQMQAELESRGFSLSGTAEDLQLVSTNGDLTIGTDRGVVYTLSVGREIEGDEQEIEIGGANQDDANQDSQADEDVAEPTSPSEVASNRFLMVRVSFDENLVADRPDTPVEPVAPMKPEGYQPAKAADPSETVPEDVQPPADDSGEDTGETGTGGDDRKPEFIAYDQAFQAYQEKQLQYEMAMEKYQQDLKAFQQRVNVGMEKVEQLNQRFGDWYYVVTADNLKTLQSNREDLVNEKQADANPTQSLPGRPNIQFPDTPQLPPVGDAGPPMPAQDAEGEKTEAESTDSSSDKSADSSDNPQQPVSKEPETAGEKDKASSEQTESDKNQAASPEKPQGNAAGKSDPEKPAAKPDQPPGNKNGVSGETAESDATKKPATEPPKKSSQPPVEKSGENGDNGDQLT